MIYAVLKLSLFSLLFSFVFQLQAQSLFIGENRVNGSAVSDHAFSMVNTTDGGFLLAGHSEGSFNGFLSKGGYDVVITKFDANGVQVWTQNYGGSLYDFSEKIIATQDGNYVISGWSQSVDGDIPNNKGAVDLWFFKIDGTGQLLWSRTYGGPGNEAPNDIIETQDGHLLMAGQTRSGKGDFSDVGGNYGSFDAWVLKLDANGILVWEQHYGGSEEDYLMSVLENSNGYIFFGSTPSHDHDLTSNHGDWDYWLFQTDTAGQSMWHKHYGGSGPEYSSGMVATANGYLLAGSTFSDDIDITQNKGGGDWWLVETDQLGNLTGEVSFGGTANESVSGVQLNAAGTHHYILGHTYSNDGDIPFNRGDFDVLLMARDLNGSTTAFQTFGGSGNEVSQALGCGIWGRDWVLAESRAQDGHVPKALGNSDQWFFTVDLSPTGIAENDVPKQVLFPNPATSGNQVFSTEFSATMQVEIWNAFGQLISLKTANSGSITLPELATGSYWLKWKNEQGVHVAPLIIQP